MYEKLPQELKDYPYFCGWKYETRNGRRTKVPKSVKGHNADNSNLDDFCSFSEIIGHMDKYDGIGIAIAGDMAAIDIDHCIEDDTFTVGTTDYRREFWNKTMRGSEASYEKIKGGTRENGKLVYIDESFVGNVIRNEVYCGVMVYGKRKNVKNPKTGKVSTQLRDESEWYRAEGLHEPIISKELFEKAQAIRKKNTYYQPKVYNPTHAAIFSGILVCPECGSPMHGVGGMGKVKLDGKHGGGQYYYSCSRHRRKK